MSFATIAQLISGQKQFFLYYFQKNGVEYRFNSTARDLVKAPPLMSSGTWLGSSVSHSRITDSSETYRSDVMVEFSINDTFARSFLEPSAFEVVNIKIFRGFLNDPDLELVPVFFGKVVGRQPKQDGKIILRCMTLISDLERKGLAAVMQRPCRHSLYNRGCNAVLVDFEYGYLEIISMTTPVNIEVDYVYGAVDGYFNGGIFSFGNYKEMILNQVDVNLVLANPVPGLIVGDIVSIYPGCNLTTTDCAGKFNNLNNYGGFPYMTDTPFDGRSIV